MSLDDLHLFVLVARERRFISAARRLGLPASTVSRRLAALEERLGTRLLQRTSRRVGLTDEGARLLERTSAPLDELLAGVGSAIDQDGDPAGRVRVTAPVLLGSHRIAPALFRFAAAYPRIELELNLTNDVVPLVEGGYDLAFRLGPIRERDLVARKLWTMPQSLAASRSFVRERLGGRTRIDRRALAGLPAIGTRASGWRLQRDDGTVEAIEPADRILVNDPRVAIAAALEGLGVICTTDEALASFGPDLVRLSVVGRTPEPRVAYAVYPSRSLVPPRVRAAIAAVME